MSIKEEDTSERLQLMSRPASERDIDLESCQLTDKFLCGSELLSSHHHTDLSRQVSALSTTTYGRPALSHQGSLVLPRTQILLTNPRDKMSVKGMDANIYHWKILNLSRAKLKASSRTSALLSGFAMVAMVEIQIDDSLPQGLLVAFAVVTILLISVHMLALMISTCILPHVEAVANLHLQTPDTVFESPHTKMSKIIELAWEFSTVFGIILFLVEICILCWVKFYNFESHLAAWVATGLLVPIIFVFIGFAAHFYLKLVGHKSEVYEHNIKELELLKNQLDNDGDTHSHNGGPTINIV